MNKGPLELINSSLDELLTNNQLNKEYLQSLINYFHTQKELSKKELLKILSEEKLTDLVYLRAKSLVIQNYCTHFTRNINYENDILRESFVNYLIFKAYEYALHKIAKGSLNYFILNQLKKINNDLKNTISIKDINKFYNWIKFVEKDFYDKINNQCLEK